MSNIESAREHDEMLPPPPRSNPMTVVLPPLVPQPPSPGSLLASDAVDVKPPPILPSCRTEPPSSYTSMSSSVRAIELKYEAVETVELGVTTHANQGRGVTITLGV